MAQAHHEALVNQVKKLHLAGGRGSAVQDRWRAFCDLYNSGKLDPNKASAETLQAFIETEERGGADFSSVSVFEQLLVKVKSGQRGDNAFKEAWAQYCNDEMGGVRDPKRHSEESLRRFLVMVGHTDGLPPPSESSMSAQNGGKGAPPRQFNKPSKFDQGPGYHPEQKALPPPPPQGAPMIIENSQNQGLNRAGSQMGADDMMKMMEVMSGGPSGGSGCGGNSGGGCIPTPGQGGCIPTGGGGNNGQAIASNQTEEQLMTQIMSMMKDVNTSGMSEDEILKKMLEMMSKLDDPSNPNKGTEDQMMMQMMEMMKSPEGGQNTPACGQSNAIMPPPLAPPHPVSGGCQVAPPPLPIANAPAEGASLPLAGNPSISSGQTDQQMLDQVMQMISTNPPAGAPLGGSGNDQDWLNMPVSQLSPEHMMKMMDILNAATGGQPSQIGTPSAGADVNAVMAQMLAGGGANPGVAAAAPSMGAPPPPMPPPVGGCAIGGGCPSNGMPSGCGGCSGGGGCSGCGGCGGCGGASPGQNACRFGMRCSSHFTQAWEWYSGFKGTGNKDPGSYNDTFLAEFFDTIAGAAMSGQDEAPAAKKGRF